MADLDARRTEMRNNAAKGVQSQFRTHVAREQFLVLRDTSIYLQSFVRGKLFPYSPGCKMHAYGVIVEPCTYTKIFIFNYSQIGM
jgi:myosin V